MENIEKTVTLPSNGLFGGPKEITIRAMTTKEEKILVSSKDFSVFSRLVKSCCVEPKDLNIDLLHQSDIMYLTYALRQITFGDTYSQKVTCPECGVEQEIEVNISEMEVTVLDTENIEEKLKVELPVNGDTLQLKLLSFGDNKRLEKQAKMKMAKGVIKNQDDYEFLIKLMELIVTKNGEEFESFEAKRQYTDTLNMRDLMTIQNAIKGIEFGLDPTLIRVCSSCYEDMEVAGLICPEFFRPTK